MVLTETTRQCQHYLIPKALELKFQFSTNIFISASITDNKNSRPKKSRRATRKSTGKSATRQDTRTALGGALSTTLSASFVDTENTVTPVVTVEEDPEKARQKSEDRSGSKFSIYWQISEISTSRFFYPSRFFTHLIELVEMSKKLHITYPRNGL